MSAWNPELYLRFKSERTQPAIDLVSRIEIESPKDVVDLGCGPGNSSAILIRRWPQSHVVGLDSSESMLEKARRDHPEIEWRLGDAAALEGDYDLLFSNAALQWIPDHEGLLPRLMSRVRSGGALAAQIPMFEDMPLGLAIEKVASRPRWREATRSCASLFTYRKPAFYYDLLSSLAARVELWTTSYYHVLESRPALLDFCRSTGLKPYLERLSSEAERADFEAELLGELGSRYALQADGKLLFPFDRQFFVAYKG
jgi:trans-aconitate 2-methyltransferase